MYLPAQVEASVKSLRHNAVKAGAVVIDNTSAFRMDPEVPLVVPEVNPEDIFKHKGIIANPNCSTIQMVQVLKPLHDYGKITRVIVSTYQAVSGAGHKAIQELLKETEAVIQGKPYTRSVFPHQIAFNAVAKNSSVWRYRGWWIYQRRS